MIYIYIKYGGFSVLHCVFDGGLDLAEMIAMDCLLEDLPSTARHRYISGLKKNHPETWNAYVAQKKKMGVIVEE